ncbi:putative AC transposase [Bienertia sinuspersici]
MENFYEPDFDPDGPPLQEEQQLENVRSTTSRSVTIDMPHARSVTIDAPHAESQPAKKCKLVDPTKEWKRRSPFWDHYSFSTVKGKDGKLVRYATCIHCHVAKYKADPKYGTSNAKKASRSMYFPPPHRGVDIYLFVVGLIKEWNIEGKTFSITCDNAGSIDVMVARLKSDLQTFGTLPLGGRFFHVRCCAHILNLIVQSGMKVIDASVLKVRETVNYIAGSDNRLVLFEKCVVDSKSNFADYPTANLYFRNIVAIEKLLVVAHTHTVASIQSMASVMMEKFEKYWSDYSILLAIAVLLDPRYKMHFVKTALGKLYVHAEVEVKVQEIYDAFVELYKFYDQSTSSSTVTSLQCSTSATDYSMSSMFESQASTFPVISQMAKDVLAVPITSVASESSFSMGDDEVQECFEVMKEVQPDDIDFDSLPTEEQ